MLDLSINVVRATQPMDVHKLSSLISAGRVIETVDGLCFRVASKIAGANGTTYNLHTFSRSFRVTASELAILEPLPRGIARLAHVLRFYAYNKDFTLYINEAIKAHGLPIDPKMDWSKWLYSTFNAASIGKQSEDALDEALHQYIVELIYEKDILSSFNPKKIKKEKNKNQPKERQVSIFLMSMFITYRSMVLRALNRLQTTTPGKKAPSGLRENLNTPMMVEPKGQGSDEVNILDAPEYATMPADPFQEADSWEDISHFRAEYGKWLKNQQREETIDGILKLFDLIINAEQTNRDEVSETSDYTQKWMKATGKSLSYFHIIATKLSESLQQFVEAYPELAETSLIARLIGDIKGKKPSFKSKVERPNYVSRAASLNLVAVAPSDLAGIPGDTGRIPHDNTGNTSNAVIVLDEKPQIERMV